jgi:gas vesicle protein
MVVMKTKIREHHDMIGRNKTDIANFQARQSEEDQQIYALIEKRAAESVKNAAMDIKGARAELMALCENNVTGIKDVKQRLAKLSGEARVVQPPCRLSCP